MDLVKGSLAYVAKQENMGLAESFLNAEIIVLLDDSGSMEANDAPGGISRREAARNELIRLQHAHPGKIALVCFASHPVFSPSGTIVKCGGTTDMAEALRFVKVADDCGIKIVLVTDGAPDSEQETLDIAKTFKSRIDCIYIGPETGYGLSFLNKLMKVTGGKQFQSREPGMLGDGVETLLLTE